MENRKLLILNLMWLTIAILLLSNVEAAEPEPVTWCLMAWEEKAIQPHCIRTFDTYEWCMFDLKTMVDESKLVPLRFSCHREDIWQPIMRTEL